MQDVLLLVNHLILHEETTVKLILDCLYDIGSVNLINQKVRCQPINGMAKWIARMSRSIFRIVALRWFKKNGPPLITRWLRTKVQFEPKPVSKPQTAAVEVAELQPKVQARLESADREIRRLQSQVRLLTGVSVGAIASLIGMAFWLLYSPMGIPSEANQRSPGDLNLSGETSLTELHR